jgi:hypothetical protein
MDAGGRPGSSSPAELFSVRLFSRPGAAGASDYLRALHCTLLACLPRSEVSSEVHPPTTTTSIGLFVGSKSPG